MTHAAASADPFDRLHPAVQYHVVNSLGWASLRPTQLEAIEPILAGTHCLLLAPTAGGKTEAAVIPVFSRMLSEEWHGVSVLYVCPIKALLNNLEERLARYAAYFGCTVQVWHGDISPGKKKRALVQPPDILLTTPESIEGMLISPRVERDVWFGQLRAVVVDELHAFAGDDRGWHLRSLMARLERYARAPVQRLGLSATVRNPVALLEWFAPKGAKQVVGSASVSTDAEVVIDHVASIENAAIVVSRLHQGKKRLVFCDSRSVAERLGNGLHELGVRTFVSHGSLSAAERKRSENAFANEKDCVIVATSTLELGIDVGDLDHVLQIDAPSSVSSFLQRMGRTGRRAGSRRNCTFLTLSDKGLKMAMAIVELWRRGWVEDVQPPPAPWGVVAQQALTVTLERGELGQAELITALVNSFPDLSASDLATLVQHLRSTQHICESADGVLVVGPTTERNYGRGHYRDLMASFSSSPMLHGRHGSSEIGLIDPTSLLSREESPIILLGGRSWRVQDVDWSKGIAWLEPTSVGGKARWQGSARDVSSEAAGALRRILQSEEPPAELSRRAKAQLEALKASTPVGEDTVPVWSRDGSYTQLWTFAGTRTNRTLARGLPAMAHRPRYDELKIEWEGPLECAAQLPTCVAPASFEELEALAESVKFSQLMPRELFAQLVMTRLWDAHAVSPATPSCPPNRS